MNASAYKAARSLERMVRPRWKWLCAGKWLYNGGVGWVTRQKDGSFIGRLTRRDGMFTPLEVIAADGFTSKAEAQRWVVERSGKRPNVVVSDRANVERTPDV